MIITLGVSSKPGEITEKFAIHSAFSNKDWLLWSFLITSMPVYCITTLFDQNNPATWMGIFKVRSYFNNDHPQFYPSIVTSYHFGGWSWLSFSKNFEKKAVKN